MSTGIWSDTWFENLTSSDKLLFIYLITNDLNNMLGIYEISLKKISFETGLNMESIRKGLEVFERVNKVEYRENYIILKNFLKYQKYNENMKKSAIDVYNNLPDTLKFNGLEFIEERNAKGFETLTKGFRMVRKVEVEVEDEIEVEDEDEATANLQENISTKKEEPNPPNPPSQDDESKKKSDREKEFIPPTLDEMKEYCTAKGYNESIGERAFNYYEELGWKDKDGKQVKNWKLKLISVWFKDKPPTYSKEFNDELKVFDESVKGRWTMRELLKKENDEYFKRIEDDKK